MPCRQPAPELGLERVYRERHPALVSFLKPRLPSATEAEDIAQAAFAQLWGRRDELTPQNLSALLFVTARNLAMDAHRRRRRAPIVGALHVAAQVDAAADQSPSAERAVIARRSMGLLQTVLAELTPKCREAFVAYRLQDRGYAEIAETMRITESMVRKYVRRATVHCAARFAELEGRE